VLFEEVILMNYILEMNVITKHVLNKINLEVVKVVVELLKRINLVHISVLFRGS
jgi:hypothetical protein